MLPTSDVPVRLEIYGRVCAVVKMCVRLFLLRFLSVSPPRDLWCVDSGALHSVVRGAERPNRYLLYGLSLPRRIPFRFPYCNGYSYCTVRERAGCGGAAGATRAIFLYEQAKTGTNEQATSHRSDLTSKLYKKHPER